MRQTLQLGYGARLLLTLGVALCCLVAASITISIINIAFGDSQGTLLASNALQEVVAFMLPSFVVAYALSPRPGQWLKIENTGGLSSWGWMAVIMLAVLPMMNCVIDWNESWVFPEGINALMRKMEDEAMAMTNKMLAGDSGGMLLLEILLVGVLTGFSEEIFFRGTLMKVIASNGMSRHLAIWITAIIFSAVHFQFFGFVPRMLLGAFFGYLYYWTSSLWVAAGAHALNNSLAVVGVWLTNRGETNWIEKIGTSENLPYTAMLSCLTVAILIFVWRRHKSVRRVAYEKGSQL